MSKPVANPFESTKACLTFDERPITPPEIRKFRRSAQMEPGKRSSRFDDAKELGLHDRVFGEASEGSDVTAAALINLPKTTMLQDINRAKTERIYQSVQREPLGKSFTRNYNMPEQCATQPFGIKSLSSKEPAKDVIFPSQETDVDEGAELYKKSHGSYGPGEQKSRHYTWKNDVNKMTFGVKGTSVAFNGVSHNIEDVLKSKGESAPCVDTQTVEAFRKRGDILGQSRYLGQGSSERGHNFVYGKGRNAKKYGAQEILSGKFSVPPSEKDDADLGKSLTPGFRNIQAPGRTYGCPSIRTDVPKISIAKRSIADSQNYGDDATACELINPHRYAHLVIDSTVYDELRTKDWLFALFKKIGYDNVHNDILEAVFDEACKLCESMSRGRKETTLEVFRSVFNHYLECLDIGQEEQWLVEHGLM